MVIVGIERRGLRVAGNDRNVIGTFLRGDPRFSEFLRWTTNAIALLVPQGRQSRDMGLIR